MCGRYILAAPSKAASELWGATLPPDGVEPRYNIAPSQDVLILRPHPETTARQWTHVRWGLVPRWAKDPAIGQRLINARAETVAQKPAFRAAFRARRCLIPATGFYEWHRPRPGAKKQPYLFQRKDQETFAFAGLWEHWRGPDGHALETCTILTAPANPIVAPVHHRMPVIVPAANINDWLGSERDGAEVLKSILAGDRFDEMRRYPVSTWVNSALHEGVECIAPATRNESDGPEQGRLL